MAHLRDEIKAHLNAQLRHRQLIDQHQQLSALHRLIVVWLLNILHFYRDFQAFLDAAHGGIIVRRHRLIVDAGIDQRRIDGTVAEQFLNRRDLALRR